MENANSKMQGVAAGAGGAAGKDGGGRETMKTMKTMRAVNLAPESPRQKGAHEKRAWTGIFVAMGAVIVVLIAVIVGVSVANRGGDDAIVTAEQVEEMLAEDAGVYNFFSDLEASDPENFAENAAEYYAQMMALAETEEERNEISLEYVWMINGVLLNEEVLVVLAEVDVESLTEEQVVMYYTQMGIAYRCLGDYEQGDQYLAIAQQYADEYGLTEEYI